MDKALSIETTIVWIMDPDWEVTKLLNGMLKSTGQIFCMKLFLHIKL